MSTRKVIEIPRHQNPFLKPLKLRTCAYVRVSTEHVAQLNSLQNQTAYYEHRIHSNPDYKYCGIYSDSGISGAKEQRPGFQAMLKAAKAGNLDLILTKSFSRFSRDTVTLLQSIRSSKRPEWL